MRTVAKRQALFSVCFAAVLLFIVREYVVGALAPRSLGIVLALVCLFGFLVSLLIIAKTKSSLNAAGVSFGYPEDEATLRRYSRRVKIAIMVLVLLLLNGVRTLRSGPLFAQLVGMAVNLSFIAALSWYLIWLRKGVRR
jgi:hypothetical protein